MMGCSVSEVSKRRGPRRAEESRDEKYPLSSIEAYLRLRERVLEEEEKRGTGGGVSFCFCVRPATGGDECMAAMGGEEWIRGEEGASVASSFSGSVLQASDPGMVASEESS